MPSEDGTPHRASPRPGELAAYPAIYRCYMCGAQAPAPDQPAARTDRAERWEQANGEPVSDTGLSEREEQVVRLIARGYSDKEAAAKMAVSVKTVETYKTRAMEKLGVKTRTALVRYAARQGWLNPDAPDWT